MKKFVYRQVEYSNYPSAEDLNLEGIEGWDLIHIFPTETLRECVDYDFDYPCSYTKKVYIATFKRELF